jgi:hypothetical protein
VVTAAAPTASARSVATPPTAATPAKPVVNKPVVTPAVTPAPTRHAVPIAPHYYAAPKPAHDNGPSTKAQMQKMLSPFGGNN